MRDRKGRQGRFDHPGETGRLTGLAIRQDVARNEDGTERVDDFFGSPSSRSRRETVGGADGKLARRQARPDMAHADGIVGRKTGIAIRSAPRTRDGMEDVPAFFASSPSAGDSTARRASARGAHVDEAELSRLSTARDRSSYSPDQLDDRYAAAVDYDQSSNAPATPPIGSPPAEWSPGPDNGPIRTRSASDGDLDVEKSLIPSPIRSAASLSPLADALVDAHSNGGSDGEPVGGEDGGRDGQSPDHSLDIERTRPAKPKTTKSKKRPFQVDDGGTRRSVRPRVERLDYWRNERCVYKREGASVGLVDVVRVPQSDGDSLSKRSRSRGRSVSRARSVRTEEIEDYSAWDKDTDPEGLTLDYVDNVEVRRRIAFTSSMIRPQPVPDRGYRFEKIFTDGVFMAGGVLEIPVKRSKAPKPSRDNSYGVLRVRVHRTVFTLAAGGLFMVPRGNIYELDNIGATTARIVFTQAREVKVAEGELDSDAVAELEGELSTR